MVHEEEQVEDRRSTTRRRLIIGGCIFAALVAANVYIRAGSGPTALPTATVRGTVTYRGQPVNGGLVRFNSTDPNDKVGQANGMLSRDGTFQFHGAPLGPVRVTIDTSNRPAEDYAPWKPESGRPKPIFIPTFFADPNRSGLDRQVEPGENVYEFRLE
jgi:hypothetical protein